MADCGSCIYRDNIDNKLACGYILVTGEPRGCDAANCTKYQRGEPEMAKKQAEFMAQFTKKSRKAGNNMITAKEKEDIKALRDSGMKLKDIAETMGMTLYQVKGVIYKGDTEDKDKDKSESKRTVEPCEDCSCEEQTCGDVEAVPEIVIEAVIDKIGHYWLEVAETVEKINEAKKWLSDRGISEKDIIQRAGTADGIMISDPLCKR